MHTNQETENQDVDHVELDKSNVLLMGPTGSGFHLFLDSLFVYYIQNSFVLIVIS